MQVLRMLWGYCITNYIISFDFLTFLSLILKHNAMAVKTTIINTTLAASTPTTASMVADGNESLGSTYSSSPTVTGDSIPTRTWTLTMQGCDHHHHEHKLYIQIINNTYINNLGDWVLS